MAGSTADATQAARRTRRSPRRWPSSPHDILTHIALSAPGTWDPRLRPPAQQQGSPRPPGAAAARATAGTAAAMSDSGGEAAPATPKKRASAAQSAVVAGLMDFMRATLSELLNPEAVDAAMKRAAKLPSVKAAMGAKAGKAFKGPKGSAPIRSNYNVFVQAAMHALKEAGVECSLTEVGGVWKALPEGQKEDLNRRYTAAREAYNAKLADGTHDMPVWEELVSAGRAAGQAPVDYVRMFNTYRGAAPANGATPQAKAPAGDAKRVAEPATEPKSHKKHKKDKEKKGKKEKKAKEKKEPSDSE
ncbi:hypothetical protein HT031_006590 [Scenedesmus sp. PABB004]|nr:hypothetical protein HT031_006590 [Scenedesmus sp. PABB004]